MATSRTGTTRWLRIARQARAQALEQGLTRCPVCRVPMDWEYPGRPNSAEVDHITPHSRGGTDTLDNTRVICRYDNQRLGGSLNRRTPRANIQTIDLETSRAW